MFLAKMREDISLGPKIQMLSSHFQQQLDVYTFFYVIDI